MFTEDYRPRFTKITSESIQRLALASGRKPNVLLRELVTECVAMLRYVERNPDLLGDFAISDINPASLLWLAGETKSRKRCHEVVGK